VESAAITLERRAVPLLPESRVGGFERLVRCSFSQRRKTMLKVLKPDWPEGILDAAFARSGVSAKVRAEAVTLEQFVGLANCLADSPALPHV
jgi:16S rRNA A1518/A1519 N6-dimethyltransferase RsmA/KsgA/DIM1 with predicted DNA glycosylase/AP lyase activity